jgi:hypothetical protein
MDTWILCQETLNLVGLFQESDSFLLFFSPKEKIPHVRGSYPQKKAREYPFPGASQFHLLMGMINSLRYIVGRLRVLGLRADSTWSRAWDEHAQLIKLLERRDKDSAIRLTQTHLANAVSDVLSGMRRIGAKAMNRVADSHNGF